jgi:hypothetical protein
MFEPVTFKDCVKDQLKTWRCKKDHNSDHCPKTDGWVFWSNCDNC